jgi:hypothetical protein
MAVGLDVTEKHKCHVANCLHAGLLFPVRGNNERA